MNNTEEEFDTLKELAVEALSKCQDVDLIDLIFKLLVNA